GEPKPFESIKGDLNLPDGSRTNTKVMVQGANICAFEDSTSSGSEHRKFICVASFPNAESQERAYELIVGILKELTGQAPQPTEALMLGDALVSGVLFTAIRKKDI